MQNVTITAQPKRANKYDHEYFSIEISGRFEKSEVRHLIQQLDDIVHKL